MEIRKSALIALLLTLQYCLAEDPKAYDENDWIPIAPPCTNCKNEEPEPIVEKKATGRVLTLTDPPQSNFFPEEREKEPRQQSFQQYLRETSSLNYQQQQQRPRPKPQPLSSQISSHPYKFENPVPIIQNRPRPKPKVNPAQQFYTQEQSINNQPQFQQQQQAPQFFQDQYHTIPQEYLQQQGLVQQQYIPQNYQSLPSIPDLPPIRLNASYDAAIQALNQELAGRPLKQIDIKQTTPKGEKENVQLVYVPLESLNQQIPKPNNLPQRLNGYQQIPVQEVQQQFNYRPHITKQQQIQDIQSDFTRQALEAHKLQLQLQQDQQPYALPIIDTTLPPTTTTSTTTQRPVSKKRKPHQPPLAVFMDNDRDTPNIADVLTLLKDAKTIDVQDSVGPDSPKIFVGPSTLHAPTNYAKFELPYLSSIDNNRVERKVDQLPFFVAPLSYKAPPGYSKIPLPSPHVGSVVISTKDKLEEKEVPKTTHTQLNLPEAYLQRQQYTIPQQQQQQQQQQHQQQQVEDYTTRRLPTLSPFPKPIPNDQIINQYELDQINGFIPQYQENIQRDPEDYFQPIPPPQVRPAPAPKQTQSLPVQQYQESLQTKDEYIQKYNTEQPKYLPEVKPSPEVYNQYSSQEFVDDKHPSLLSQEQYVQEVTPENKQNYETYQQTRNTRPNTRPTTQSYYEQQYQPEVSSTFSPHHQRRTRPTTPAPQYEVTHSSRVRTRPTTPSTTTTTTEEQEQYLKETIVEARPTHTRPRPQSIPHYEEDSVTNGKLAYSSQEYVERTTTQQPQIQVSSTPKIQNIDENLYLPRPTQNTYEDEDRAKVHYAILENFESGKATKPVEKQIYEYKPVVKTEIRQQPFYSSTPKLIANQHILNQETLDTKILSQDSGNYLTGPQQIYEQVDNNRGRLQYHSTAEGLDNLQHEIKTHNANVENYNFAGQLNNPNGALPSLINNLEDQQIRQLLHPGIIPTSTQGTAQPHYEINPTYPVTAAPSVATTTTPEPTNYPSTHLPLVETTTKRIVRGRQRGTRFSTTTQSSLSTTRRAVTRGRRPLPTRTRYEGESESVTEYSARGTTDPTKKIISTARSRFRTRGRPAQSEAPTNEVKVSTTEKFYKDELGNVQVQQTYGQNARVIDQSVPQLQQFDDQYIVANYKPVYNVQSEKKEKVINVAISEPATEPVVIHQINQLPIRNLDESQESNADKNLLRQRVRSRVRPTTIAPQTSTRRKIEEAEERDESDEFYGFFRQPNFKQSTEAVPATESTPQKSVYSSTYISSSPKYAEEEYVHPVRYQMQDEKHSVQFIGEIRPKYQITSSGQFYEVTQPSVATERQFQSTTKSDDRVRIRGRVRVPSRRITNDYTETTRSNNEVKSREETTRPTRVRTRGKTHFKAPTKPKESTEDEDVEGGNYPPQFKAQTIKPFQITVDPHIDDQEPYSSIYRPTYIAKQSNSKDQSSWFNNDAKTLNDFAEEKVTVDEPTAMPIVSDNNETETVTDEKISEDATTTLLPETTTAKRRRGVWKVIKRPIDVFESAESQNLGTVKSNLFTNEEKQKYKGKLHVLEIHNDSGESEVTTLPQTEDVTSTTEAGFFNSLYEMFGIGNKDKVEESVEEVTTQSVEEETTQPDDTLTTFTSNEQQDTTEEVPTTSYIEPEISSTTSTTTTTTTTTTTPKPAMTFITPMSLETWNLGILKTSTSTEISHETEICYKGKCIKSKDMKVPMT